MKEVIEAITEFEEAAPDYGNEAGFKIKTNRQEIILAINSNQDCCEEWGYFLTEDDQSKFIGATLYGLRVTDTNRSSREISPRGGEAEGDIYLDEGDVLFVDINTSKGILQFVAYNAHNGYYGHEARIVSRDLKHEASL